MVHIGYPKTGTTWMQECVLNNQALGFASRFTKKQLLEWLVFPHPLDFDAKECRGRFEQTLTELQRAGLIPVISRERLSGCPYSGGYDSREIAERLKSVFPEAKVLMVIREQKRMILSTYKQYVKIGGACSVADYLRPATSLGRRIPLFDFDHFKYHRLINCYIDLFGRANVLALPYELFAVAPEDFVRHILLFCELESKLGGLDDLPYERKLNEAFSASSTLLKRRLNGLIVGDSEVQPWTLLPVAANARVRAVMRRVGHAMPRAFESNCDRRLQRQIADLVEDRYRESNLETARLLNTDLAQYGYDVESESVGGVHV